MTIPHIHSHSHQAWIGTSLLHRSIRANRSTIRITFQNAPNLGKTRYIRSRQNHTKITPQQTRRKWLNCWGLNPSSLPNAPSSTQ